MRLGSESRTKNKVKSEFAHGGQLQATPLVTSSLVVKVTWQPDYLSTTLSFNDLYLYFIKLINILDLNPVMIKLFIIAKWCQYPE